MNDAGKKDNLVNLADERRRRPTLKKEPSHGKGKKPGKPSKGGSDASFFRSKLWAGIQLIGFLLLLSYMTQLCRGH